MKPLDTSGSGIDPQRGRGLIRQTLGMRGIWKWVGLAGVAGVVAGGALVARDQRRRNAYTPEDIRARLHKRVAEADDGKV